MNPFVRPRAVERPSARLVAFHHAGGSAGTLFSLAKQLPSDWDLLILDLPGRGKRHDQVPLTRMADVVSLALRDLGPWLDAPLLLFGHSFGAIVASEVAFALEARGLGPRWLGVSGRIAPTEPRPARKLHQLPDAALLDELLGLGGTTPRIHEVPEFRERFVEVARADLQAVESYVPTFGHGKLSCRIAAFSGRADPWAPPRAMASWRLHTALGFEHFVFAGGHFYFHGDAFAALSSKIVADARGCDTSDSSHKWDGSVEAVPSFVV